jgi:hypothetical protein
MSQAPPDPIQLDATAVAAKAAARYQRIIAQLVDENARLETYIAQLLSDAPPPPDVPSS